MRKQELEEVSKKLDGLYKEMRKVKCEAQRIHWPLHGKKVRLKETGEIYWARIHDILNDRAIHISVRYDLCKSENLKRKVQTVHELEIEPCEEIKVVRQ